MNDDFLHRIRVEPPADFMASLKGRLDRQLPPAAAAPRRSLLRALVFGLLFGGSVFAISLLTVNGLPDFARNLVQTRHQDSKVDGTGNSPAATRSRSGSFVAPAQPGQPAADAPSYAGKAADSSRNTAAPGPANSTAPTAQSIPGGSSTGPRQVVSLITPKTLQEYIRSLADSVGRSATFALSVTATDSSSDALTQLCGTSKSSGSASVLAAASVPRRITRAEYEVCTRNLGGIAEVQLGHQAIVLTRSRLYGALALSPSDIFLALAAEIPDPAHPETLISNPNTTWDRVNDAFNNEPIEVFGPPAQSTTGSAFREILFAAGCNSFPTIAALKQTDAARYERVCSTFRKDGAYVEMPEQVPFDIFQTLQTHPNAVGVLGYRLFQTFGYYPQGTDTLTTSPVGGVKPTRETISAGTYPGSRILYLYVDQSRSNWNVPFLITSLMENGRVFPKNYSVIPTDAAQVEAIRNNPAKLTDLKL
jgi:phosphate transport system substrate-binding protein